jgi:hypothetical protein
MREGDALHATPPLFRYQVPREVTYETHVVRNALLGVAGAVLTAAAGIGGWTAFTAQADIAATRSEIAGLRQELRQNQLTQNTRNEALSGRVDANARRTEDVAGREAALESSVSTASGRFDVIERQLVSLANAVASLVAQSSRVCFRKGQGGEFIVPCSELTH